MDIVQQPQDHRVASFSSWHKLLPAEAGFSMLNLHAENHGINQKEIDAFAKAVNDNEEPGTLHPRAPISALPVRYFRDLAPIVPGNHVERLRQHLKIFLKLNKSRIHAANLLVDLHVSPDQVPHQYIAALQEELLTHGEVAGLEHVLIFL
jgi:hypothetical protein